MNNIVIEIKGLSKKYKDEYILRDINLNIEKGKIYAFVGENGAGKSMLLKCIAGLIIPTTGSIAVDGEIVGDKTDFPQNIGITLDVSGFLPYYSGRKNLEILASIRKKVDKARISEVLDIVDMSANAKKRVGTYSTGMKQRLAIAQAIMEDPDIVLLDEPMNGLDIEGMEEIRTLLLHLVNKGKTIVMATHSEEDVKNLCDVIVTLKNGSIASINYNVKDVSNPALITHII